MTTATENKAKKIPDFTIFVKEGEKNKQVGAVFNHGKGGGFNILIGNVRYTAFPTRAKTLAPGQE
jgi:hypothetical protein